MVKELEQLVDEHKHTPKEETFEGYERLLRDLHKLLKD